MISISSRSVAHCGMFVPCFEGRVLAVNGQPTRLIRLQTRSQAEAYARQFGRDLVNGRPLSFMMGDNYMLTQPPLSGGIELVVSTAAADCIHLGEADSLEESNERLCEDFADRLG